MAPDTDVTADSLAHALSTLFGLGQAGVDWTSVAAAVLSFREEERQRWLDHHDELSGAAQGGSAPPPVVRRPTQAGGNAPALFIELQAGLLTSLMRAGRDWQRLLKDCAPALQRAVDAYRADADPSPRAAEALVNQLAVFTQAVGEFLRDQGQQAERDLQTLVADALGRHDHGTRPIAAPATLPPWPR